MRKQIPKLDWQIVEDDAEWERQQALLAQEMAPAANGRLRLQRSFLPIAALLVLLVSGGLWWSEGFTLSPSATNPKAPAEPAPDTVAHRNDQWEQDWWRQFGPTYSDRRPYIPLTEPEAPMDITVQTIDFAEDQAVVRVIIKGNSTEAAYRETWFYRHTPVGWLRTPPDANIWGAERTLATPHFRFQFRQRDAVVVQAVAPQLDALYTTLWRNFGLPLRPSPEQLTIKVSITQSPGRISVFDAANQLSVASPARYLAPVTLTDADLLAQSLALPLLDHVVAQARTYHRIGPSWQPLVDGLSLWQLWDADLPLTRWRKEIVQWLYIDFPTPPSEQTVILPPHYTKLCASHRLWLWSPLQMHIPLICTEQRWEKANLFPWNLDAPPTRVDQLSGSAPAQWGRGLTESHPGQAVALATLMEYIVTTYGEERLPLLVAGLGQYESWDTLLSAVFGVSVSEFEAGWRTYLADRYAVPP